MTSVKKQIELCRKDVVEFSRLMLGITFTPVQIQMMKMLEKKPAKQKKRPRAIRRWFRRMWCRIRGIHYVEVRGMGRGGANKDNGKRYNMIIIDDMEEENNNAKNRVNDRTIR